MMNRLIAPVVMIAIFSIAPAGIQAQDGQTYRWKLNLDEDLIVKLTQSTGISTRLNNRTQKIGNEMLLEMDWKILEVNDDNFLIEQKIARIKLTINAPGKSGVKITTIDTSENNVPKGLATELLAQIKPLVGTVCKVTMNARGQIESVEIPASSMEILRAAPSSMQIREVLTEEGLIQLFGQAAIVFPEPAISTGHQWQSTSNLESEIGTLTRTNQFQLSDVTDSSSTFSVTTTAEVSQTNKDVTISNFSGSGRFIFQADADKIVDSRMTNQLTTSRNYRDKKIDSTVKTEVNILIRRK